jgi:hypothetical protein
MFAGLGALIPQRLEAIAGGRVAPTINREQWLTNFAVLLRPWFRARGFEIPLRIRLGVGALSANRRVLGVCHTRLDRDGFRHITISPFFDDPVMVGAVLLHELIHAILPEKENHGQAFAAAAEKLGLLRPVTQVAPGPELRAHLQELVRQLGPYPHRALCL